MSVVCDVPTALLVSSRPTRPSRRPRASSNEMSNWWLVLCISAICCFSALSSASTASSGQWRRHAALGLRLGLDPGDLGLHRSPDDQRDAAEGPKMTQSACNRVVVHGVSPSAAQCAAFLPIAGCAWRGAALVSHSADALFQAAEGVLQAMSNWWLVSLHLATSLLSAWISACTDPRLRFQRTPLYLPLDLQSVQLRFVGDPDRERHEAKRTDERNDGGDVHQHVFPRQPREDCVKPDVAPVPGRAGRPPESRKIALPRSRAPTHYPFHRLMSGCTGWSSARRSTCRPARRVSTRPSRSSMRCTTWSSSSCRTACWCRAGRRSRPAALLLPVVDSTAARARAWRAAARRRSFSLPLPRLQDVPDDVAADAQDDRREWERPR